MMVKVQTAMESLLIVLSLSSSALAFNILVIVSMPLRSHYMAFGPLFRELAIKRHNVTVMNNFPDKDPPPNLRFVDIEGKKSPTTPSLEFYEHLDSTYMHHYNTLRHITLGSVNIRSDCENLFQSKGMKAHLSEGNKYDVIFVEQFMSDCGLAYALTLYDAPIIGITSHTLLPMAYPRLGLPFDVAADAFYFSNSGPNPSLLQKLETFALNAFFTSLGRWYLHTRIYEVFDRFVPNNTLDIERDVNSRMKMMFSYQHHSITGARVLAPQLLEIGGIHVGVPKSVSKSAVQFGARLTYTSITSVMNPTTVIFLTVLLTSSGLAFDILVIISMPVFSHEMAFRPLFRELANRGHNVTMINNFSEKDSPRTLKFVNLGLEMNQFIPSLEDFENLDSRHMHLHNIFYRLTYLASFKSRLDCENLFQSKRAKAHLSEGNKYDVIFVEQFMSDCGLAYALTMYDAPIIGITSQTLLPIAYPRLGLPFDVAADAFYFSNSGPNPSLLQKLETFVLNAFFTSIGRWYLHTRIYEVFERFVPNNTLDIERDVKSRMKMMFSYQHHSITGARVLAPQLLEIGGIHVGVPKNVSKEIEEFLSDAEHGAIYVSFGSNLKASTMSEKKRQQFLTAFKRIPQKVIWKYEDAPFKDKKILTASWFSQLDILCHPKVLAFVSHGGMLSLSESAHCGKPMLTVPFFGDQFSNSAAVRSVGLGKTLYFDKINADNLEEAIKDLTSDEMQQNARRVSRLWHDRPQPVMDSAIYWTEYVARHKTSPPSLPAKHNTWFESTLIDVYIVLLVILAGFFFVVRAILRVFGLVLSFVVSLFSRSVVLKKKKKKGKRD